MSSFPTEPGWYPDPTGEVGYQAYWNGTGWTGEIRPGRTRHTRIWVVIAACILVVVLAGWAFLPARATIGLLVFGFLWLVVALLYVILDQLDDGLIGLADSLAKYRETPHRRGQKLR